MKSLKQKIFEVYPQLERDAFHPVRGTILLAGEGEENYIAKWEHPTLARPTQEQLDGVTQ